MPLLISPLQAQLINPSTALYRSRINSCGSRVGLASATLGMTQHRYIKITNVSCSLSMELGKDCCYSATNLSDGRFHVDYHSKQDLKCHSLDDWSPLSVGSQVAFLESKGVMEKSPPELASNFWMSGKMQSHVYSSGHVCEGEGRECAALQKLKASGKSNQMQNLIKFPNWRKFGVPCFILL